MNPATSLQIRRGNAADAETLSRCMADWFLAAYAHASDAANTAAFVRSNFDPQKQARELADPQIVTLIAQDGEDWAGYAQLRLATPTPDCVARSDAAELGRFYFAPAQHGRGSAGQMMQAVRAEARARGRSWLWLLVWQEQPQAIRFYEKQGFEKVGTAIFMVGEDRKHDFVMCGEVG